MTDKKDYDRACIQIDAQAEHIGELMKENAKLKNNLEEKDSIISNLRSDIRTEQDGKDELNETNRQMYDHITELKSDKHALELLCEGKDLSKAELKGEVNQMQRHWDEEQDCRGQVEHQLELCEASRRKLAEQLVWYASRNESNLNGQMATDGEYMGSTYWRNSPQEAIQSWIDWSEEAESEAKEKKK